MTNWYVGTMGFAYDQWRNGIFYPAGMPQRQFLGYYSQRFNAVEMDSTFYATPSVSTIQRWRQVTPPDFKISPKVPRHITHELRLHDTQDVFQQFLAAIRQLGTKLGPIVLQFPPDFTFDQVDTFTRFISLLPKDLRFAVEFRHLSWHHAQTAVLLQEHHLCWVAADYIHLPPKLHCTTDFLYLRFIGPHGQYVTKDRELVDKTPALQAWYSQIQPHLKTVTAVYAFCNNDYAGFSPATCTKFKQIVGIAAAEIRPLQQGRLF